MNRFLTVLLAMFLPVSSVWAVKVGEQAHEFNVESLVNGETIQLKQFKGRWVYLDFWASWCGPCRKSLPAMEQLQQEFGQRGFSVVAISLDEKREDAERFIRRWSLSYPLGHSGDGSLARQYQVAAMPSSYIIDPAGRVQLVHHGFRKGDLEALRQLLSELLKQK